jgi:long-chain acyl-CoA synthetase
VDIVSLIRQRAKEQPYQPALRIEDSDETLTYSELVRQAEQCASRLSDRGCRPEERCGLFVANPKEFLVSALGILESGLCIAPMGTFLPEEEKDYAIKAAALNWLLEANQRLIRMPFAAAVDDADDKAFRASSPAYVRFTSGSTGRRKGVLLGHQTILNRLNAANEVLKITPKDKIWFTLPMADHFVVSILLYLSRGATVVISDSSTGWKTTVQLVQPTIIYGAPDFFQELARSDVKSLDSVRLAISTTAPLPRQTGTEFGVRFGKKLNPALGIIEVGLLTLNTDPNKSDSVGTAMPAYKVTLVGEDGQVIETGETGELHVSGPGLFDAYLTPWRPLNTLMRENGFPTGDFARRDKDGYLYLLGRGKNRLQVDGLQFFCEEVETALNTLPGIKESRVFLDPDSGQLSAEIVGPVVKTQRLEKLLLEQFDARKVPRMFQVVDRLPRTPNGKLRRE